MLSQNARTVHSCKFAEEGVRWNCRKRTTFAASRSSLGNSRSFLRIIHQLIVVVILTCDEEGEP